MPNLILGVITVEDQECAHIFDTKPTVTSSIITYTVPTEDITAKLFSTTLLEEFDNQIDFLRLRSGL